ncbi:hypothetical protein FHS27_003744 [Rhodopirellula rubra]|uniref:Secreted protein n=1 Tax=Aporhodopirellula rubra TaxID=980271 RepID=A0A7W5E261_9BACT|nr:hypothetical protein [Aporhodopirellula rubra]MBB3207917.1 hypothetical protein [Aporhodopirellula rubra]
MSSFKFIMLSMFVACLFMTSGCGDPAPTVVQPDPETRTYPQSDPGDSMDAVQ